MKSFTLAAFVISLMALIFGAIGFLVFMFFQYLGAPGNWPVFIACVGAGLIPGALVLFLFVTVLAQQDELQRNAIGAVLHSRHGLKV